MDKQQLRNILQQPYRFENWKQVVDFVFPNVSYFRDPQPIPHSSDKIQSFRQLGTVRLNDWKNLAMFEIKVAENINIPRNRVALRSLVAPLIDQERNHGVLVIYEQGKEDYRFTFTAKETGFDEDTADFVQRETDRKRFTYVLGSNESCRTAGDRFFELSSKKNHVTIKDVESAFSVERLSKEFFTKYKAHYAAFVDYLAGSNYKVTAFKGDEKRIRDFVKVLLGRIVFLHFVQKKGWLGASDTEFADGNKNFMLSFWDAGGKNESFYIVRLATLFFEALNKDGRPNQAFAMPDGSTVCVPFLGGGLFEKDRNEPELLTFPPQLFDELFNFFGEYNFTIDENDPLESEVGIDPEMLGHIFENLLEDNKDKGAFYTPKPIVKYMCQESLIQYLLTQLEQNGLFEPGSEAQKAMEEKLGNFVKKYEAGDLIDYDNLLAKTLHTIKVCDPAIGSGAFPMGILNEMVMLINVLHQASPDVVEETWKMDDWQPATVKKHIIQNSIYGVDIEKGAVDIARLRFWLSLVLDEEKPSALPSLDYKIVVGNSLLSKLGDDIIDIDWSLNQKNNDLFGEELAAQKKALLKKLISQQRRFYTALGDKEELAAKIRKLKIDLLINQLDLMLDRQNFLVAPKAEDYRNKPKARFTADYNRYLQCMGWKQQIEKLKSLKAKPDIHLEFFDWKLDFPEVMNEQVAERVGFDVVIGNPPYVITRKDVFPSYKWNSDLYLMFFELSLNSLLMQKGVLHFITPKFFLLNQNCFGFRKYLVNEVFIKSILLSNPFETVVTENAIILIKNTIATFEKIPIFQFINGETVKINSIPLEVTRKNRYYEIQPFYNSCLQSILDKIEHDSFKMSEIVKSKRGAEIGKKRLRENSTGIRCLLGGDVTSYSVNFKEGYICKSHKEFLRLKDFFESDNLLYLRRVTPTLISAVSLAPYAFNKNIYGLKITTTDYNKYHLCGLLNSNLLRFYYKNKYSTKKDDVFPEIQTYLFENLPIKKIQSKLIIEISRSIVKKKSQGNETTALEQQIDNLVYRLYDLTYEEVKVIDPEFGLSEEEYNSIKLEE